MMKRYFIGKQFSKATSWLRIGLILMAVLGGLTGLKTCDLPTAPGPQPTTLIETEFEPGLNIFGVLRADSISGSSFFHVERAATTADMYAGKNVFDTTATVILTDLQTAETFSFTTVDDSMRIGYYYNADFQAVPGHHYAVTVQSDDLPVLTGTTIVPTRPQILTNSLNVNGDELSFGLKLTSDTYEYVCYLFTGSEYVQQEFLNNGGDSTIITFNLDGLSAAPTALVIVGYDNNLMEYANSTPSFIPQTYHEMVNTVENGYGCFGSLAATIITL
jgi:hypothetical protein